MDNRETIGENLVDERDDRLSLGGAVGPHEKVAWVCHPKPSKVTARSP
jgi:hypothetical protein